MQAKTSREELIAKSFDHVWRHGFSATSVKDIVENAGILKGSFYNYFESKDQFIAAVVDAYAVKWLEIVSGCLLNETIKPRRRFKQLFKTYKDMYEGKDVAMGCLAGNLAQEIGGHHPELSAQIESVFSNIEGAYAQCIQDGIASGEISSEIDANSTASMLHNAMQGAFLRMKTKRTTEPLKALEKNVMNLIFQR